MPDHDHMVPSPTGTDAAPCAWDEPQSLPKAELRIALVMNGGVSLAVWMGGVTHELDLLRRASRGDHADTVPEKEREVFGIWQEVAQKAGVEVKIDIISGTSAGGLNGLLLATGIARGSQLLELRQLWRDVASLDELCRQRRTRREALLDGDWFRDQVKEVLDDMLRGPECRERVTLFVTATALDGRHRAYEDAAGSLFSVRDHRRMYRFRNEPETFRYVNKGASWEFEKWATREFAEAHNEALVTAARATASYPVAFQPVSEHSLLAYRVHPGKELDVPASCVMDGGVLNNAPFTPVLDEITERRGGPAERVVMFVAPSGGVLADEAVKDRRCDEISRRTAAWSALNYPQEVDFRSGIEDVQFRLEISGPRSRDELLCRLLEGGRATEDRMREAAQALYAEYRRSRVLAVRKRLAVTNARVTALKAADEPLEEIITQVLTQEDLKWLPPSTVESLSAPGLEEWCWGITPAGRLLQNLLALLHLLLRKARKDNDSGWARRVSEAIPFVNDSLLRVLAINEVVRRKTQWDECPPGPCEEAIKLRDVFTDLSEGVKSRS
jgi:patatin-related protein